MPQLLWFKRIRQNLKIVFIIAILINIGMWFERFVIIVGSLYQDFLPANWGIYIPTWVDIGTLPRHARRVFHAVSVVRAVSADDCGFRSQRRHAAG